MSGYHEDDPQEWLCDREAERSLLHACLWSKQARIESRRHITPADFWVPAHETIYQAMLGLDRHGKTVDAVTLHAALEAAGAYKPAGQDRGDNGLRTVVAGLIASPTGYAGEAGVRDWCAIMRGRSIRRRLVDEATRLRQKAETMTYPVERLAAETVTALTGVRDSGPGGDVTAQSLSELMDGTDDDPRWVIPG